MPIDAVYFDWDMTQRPRRDDLTKRNDQLWWSSSTIPGGPTTTFLPTSTGGQHASTTPKPGSGMSSQSGGQGGTSSGGSGTSTPTSSAGSGGSSSGVTGATTSSGSSSLPSGATVTTYTTTSSFPVSVTRSGSTFTSTSQTVITSSSTIFATPSSQVNAQSQPVCIGDGLDASADGLLATIILPSAIGLLLWLLFAILRPRYRQLYALREWFVQPDLRPKPLGNGLFAFLHPHVPLVPSVPSDVSDAGRSAADDAKLFPSDDELSQRSLWIAFLIVAGWTLLGLAGALPLYLVNTPCLAQQSEPQSQFGGVYSTLQDLSLLRLLRLLDSDNQTVTTVGAVHKREVLGDDSTSRNLHIRLIILTVLVIVLALLPALWKIIKEFNRTVAYYRRWVDVHCEGKEMAWLSASQAPGFVGWGEKQLKDFILKSGLSSSLEHGVGRNGTRNGLRSTDRRSEEQALSAREEADLEVDIQNLFSISDTHNLALLIDERDEILENLEIAETRYISSFRLSTPDPSIATFEPPEPPPDDNHRPTISRPKALGGSRSRRRRAVNPAYAASSLAPTTFVAPSQYYKLRGVQGVNGGRFADSVTGREPQSLSESIHARVVGSRFQEMNRDSQPYGALPLGSHVQLEKSGELVASPESSSFVRSPRFGPNHGLDPTDDTDEFGMHRRGPSDEEEEDQDWVDLTRDAPETFEESVNGAPLSPPGSSTLNQYSDEPGSTRRRPPRSGSYQQRDRPETFPFRSRTQDAQEQADIPPPHLRLQPRQPFVRPLSGMDHEDLGAVYGDISQWRSKLKQINAEIAAAQRASYNDIADGARIKGWLMIGRGLHFIPGVQLIEGRAKEDIRWDVLQTERGTLDSVALWTVIGLAVIFLGASLTAVAGLALSTAPDFAHYLSFLQPLEAHDNLWTGLAIQLAPAVATSVFIVITLAVVDWAVKVRGSVSVSGGQLLAFKTTFFILTAVSAIWLITIGALLFALQAFNSNSSDTDSNEAKSVANGSIYISALCLVIVVNVAIIFPALLMLQPLRLRSVLRAEREAVTPRQRFRAVYPRSYNPSFATGACILGIIFACTFSLIFPLIGPAVVVLLFLTLIAHRYLVGYVYGRTHSQSGGLLQIWLLRRFGTLLALQPFLLGLIMLSRRFWIEGGILVGTAVAVVVFVEVYAGRSTRFPGRKSLSPITQNSLHSFEQTARRRRGAGKEGEGASLVSSGRPGIGDMRTRGSMASVLEMMSLTLAVMPSSSRQRGPVPLKTETLDDLTATERAARTHPDAPPHLPALPFSDHADDMAGILYAPELIAPPPIIWLPNDSAGVARSEAYDLQRYHDLQVTLDVRAKEDVLPRRSSSSAARRHAL